MQSPLSGKDVKIEQILVETVCMRLAKFKKEEIRPGFWKLPGWSKFYKLQIILAHQLTKIYPTHNVLDGLNRCYFVCTLRDKRLDDAIQESIDREPKPIEKSVGTWQSTKRNKLRDI
jgi:hypothetical protein